MTSCILLDTRIVIPHPGSHIMHVLNHLENFLDRASFSSSTSLVIALSGGIDSMCLAYLLVKIYKKRKWPSGNIHCVHVDHKLRQESTQQAKNLKTLLKKHTGLELTTLVWETEKPLSRLQEKARYARYDLLTTYCKKHNIKCFLTAHHQDDQLETFFMRLCNGSGLKGLSGIAEHTKIADIHLWRPLLFQTKSSLRSILEENNITWIEDISNTSEFYERNRWRKTLQNLDKNLFNTQKVSLSMDKLRRVDKEFSQMAASLVKEQLITQPGGWWLLNTALSTLGFELFKRVLDKLTNLFNDDNNYPPRERAYQHIYNKISLHQPCTFQGLYIVPKNSSTAIFREPRACETMAGSLEKGQSLKTLWDNRIPINFSVPESAHYTVTALTEPLWQKIVYQSPQALENIKRTYPKLPGPALFSLPCLHTNGIFKKILLENVL